MLPFVENGYGHHIRPPMPDEDTRFGDERPASRRNSHMFRPESAPTVLDMSPDNSLSGPPSVVRSLDLNNGHEPSQTGDDLSGNFHLDHDLVVVKTFN